ncbi:MAG: small integral membrane transport protein [Hyphomicrobiales bacterium]|nr:MAG: small integral membrane transport protein [Hyphomicrobiales bacterium]
MPSIDFVMPHWLYWGGLIAFPLIAMYLARQKQPLRGSRTLGIAYFIWVVGGLFGFHRLYLKNKLGLLYWPLFAIILFGSSMQREARIEYSNATGALIGIENATKRSEKRIVKSERAIERAQTQIAELPADDTRGKERIERTIKKDTDRIDSANEKISGMATERAEIEPTVGEIAGRRDQWSDVSYYAFLGIMAFMLVDLFLMPRMLKRALALLAANPDDEVQRVEMDEDSQFVGTGFIGMIDRLSLYMGEFVALWSVIAVFVYYYEVIMRYVFNSPTNWAHEGMFLMFGMQYLIAGAYAMLTESHVRVDIFYANYSPRGKAIIDLLTSVFFFIFAGTLVWTGWIFARDSIGQNEVSFTEWGIQYWPVKITIIIGGVLLVLQGVSHFVKDATLVFVPNKEAKNGS